MTEHDREIWFLEEMLAILCQYLSKFSFIKKKKNTQSLSGFNFYEASGTYCF